MAKATKALLAPPSAPCWPRGWPMHRGASGESRARICRCSRHLPSERGRRLPATGGDMRRRANPIQVTGEGGATHLSGRSPLAQVHLFVTPHTTPN